MRKKKVVIIGAGIAGLTLAYALRQNGRFDFKMIMASDVEDIRNGRILSTQAHFEASLQTEERFGIQNYGAVNEFKSIEMVMNGQRMFRGNLKCRAVSQDQRLYLSNLIDGLSARGVEIQKKRLASSDLSALANEYDLIVDCTGKRGPIAAFPQYEGLLNTPSSPPRVITAGMFYGLELEDKHKMGFNIVPGQGELFESTTMARHGLASSLLLEAIPGSDMDCIKGIKGPDAFISELLDVLKVYFPHIYDKVNVREFRPIDPLSYIRMAIQPEVRIPYTTINGTLVIGCGDSVALNDPITGQGANAAFYCASTLYDVLSDNADGVWDTSIGEQYWAMTKEYVTKMSEWTNAMMGPPSEAFSRLMAEASQSQQTADELVHLFTNPIEAHRAFFAAPKQASA